MHHVRRERALRWFRFDLLTRVVTNASGSSVAAAHVPPVRGSAIDWRLSARGRPATTTRVPAPPACAPLRCPRTPARSYNGKRLGAHVISESDSVTHFPAIQVYVSARSRGCATARAGGRGGRPTDPVARCRSRAGLPRTTSMFTFAHQNVASRDARSPAGCSIQQALCFIKAVSIAGLHYATTIMIQSQPHSVIHITY